MAAEQDGWAGIGRLRDVRPGSRRLSAQAHRRFSDLNFDKGERCQVSAAARPAGQTRLVSWVGFQARRSARRSEQRHWLQGGEGRRFERRMRPTQHRSTALASTMYAHAPMRQWAPGAVVVSGGAVWIIGCVVRLHACRIPTKIMDEAARSSEVPPGWLCRRQRGDVYVSNGRRIETTRTSSRRSAVPTVQPCGRRNGPADIRDLP